MVLIQAFGTLILTVLLLQVANGLVINATNVENNATLSDIISFSDIQFLPNFGGHYYDFHIDPQTWNEARQICNAEQGYLAIINSENEAQFLAAIFSINPPSSFDNGIRNKDLAFIGLNNFFGEWVTVDGQNVEETGYNYWRIGEPNNQENENCGAVDRNGQLNNYYCNIQAAYICEIPPLWH